MLVILNILHYTDDIPVVNEHGEDVLRKEIRKYFELKEESIGPPKIYLGRHIQKGMHENGMKAWSFSSWQYVQ